MSVDHALSRNEFPSCTLDQRGVEEQKKRYARLAPGVSAVERSADALRFSFATDFDHAALAEAIAVERQCCPFFKFAFDADARVLTVGVADREMLPALDAIAAQLGAPPT